MDYFFDIVNDPIIPNVYRGLSLYKLTLNGDHLIINEKVKFREGEFYVNKIHFYDILLNIIVFEIQGDDIMKYCYVKIIR